MTCAPQFLVKGLTYKLKHKPYNTPQQISLPNFKTINSAWLIAPASLRHLRLAGAT